VNYIHDPENRGQPPTSDGPEGHPPNEARDAEHESADSGAARSRDTSPDSPEANGPDTSSDSPEDNRVPPQASSDRAQRRGEGQRIVEIEHQLEQDPENQSLLLEAARCYHRYAMQGDELALYRADQSTKNLLKLDKRNVEALAIAGSLLTIKARRSGSLLKRIWYSVFAARKLDKALVLPGFLRRLQTAVGDFEYLIKMKCEDPSRLPDEMMPKVYLNLGLAYAKLRDRERAKQILTFVVDSYPGTGEHNRAKSLLGKLADRGW
jgi:hypothetical protein